VASLRNLFVVSFLSGAVAFGADSSLLSLVMPDAQVLCGANVERILKSEIGKEIGSQIQGKLPELQQAIQKTGFDPAKDLKEVLIAATGKGANGPALVLVRGSFDPDKVRAAIASTGRTPQVYQGVQILDNPSQTNGAFAFLDGTIAVGGDLDQVQAAIRRRSHATALGPQLAARVAAISDRYDVWVVSAVSLSKMTDGISSPQMKQAGDLVKAIDQVSGGVKFTKNLDLGIELTTHSAKEAEKLRDAVQMIIGMAAASQKDSSALDLNALKLTAEEKTVRMAFTVTSEQLKKTYELQMAKLQHATPQAPAAKPVVQDTGLTIQSSERDMGTVVLSSTK
jgi:hypothetical protein